MKREEIGYLTARLNELADYYGTKHPTTAALKIWGDCLEGMQWNDVAAVLTDWPKFKQRFPLGDEVRKMAAGLLSDRMEQQAKVERDLAPTVESVMYEAPDTPNARAFKRMWQAWRSGKVDSPRQWCDNVLLSDKANEELKNFAGASLKLMGEAKEVKRWDTEEALSE